MTRGLVYAVMREKYVDPLHLKIKNLRSDNVAVESEKWTIADERVIKVKNGRPTLAELTIVNRETGQVCTGKFAYVHENSQRR